MMQDLGCLSEMQEIFSGMVEDETTCAEKVRFMEISERMRWSKKSVEIWKLEKDEEADSRDLLSVESCRSSAVDHVEEMSLESPRKIQDVQVVMSETAGEANDRKRRRCVETGTKRGNRDDGNQSCSERGGRRPRGP